MDWQDKYLNNITCGDCLKHMKNLSDNSVDLIIADPPYNIKKAEWDKIPNYIEWLGSRLLEMRRVLKDNGSLYLFHNDFLQMVEIQNLINRNAKFVFKQLIVWNKKFTGVSNEGYLQGFNEVDGLRNYLQMVEYILFYTFQDDTGLTKVKLDLNNFTSLREYFRDFQKALGLTLSQINKQIGDRRAEHAFYWNSSQWDLPTKETYLQICEMPLKQTFIVKTYDCIHKEYEFVCREYEDLRREYEDLRYIFNNQKTHHSVWNYEIADRVDHITPKPIPLIENILRYSSNKGSTVLIPFVGSGNDCIACEELDRYYIGFELNPEYCKIAETRIIKAKQQLKLL